MSTQTPTRTAERRIDVADEETSRSLRTHDGVVERNDAQRAESCPWGWRTHLPADEELADMTDREREVFLSVEVHGFSPAELAREVGVEPSTIRTLLQNAREARRNV